MHGDFRASLERTLQKITGQPAKINDTSFAFTYPSRGRIDTSYSRALQGAKLVDAELASDVLNIDFTRPIFSGQRCSLLTNLSDKKADQAAHVKEADDFLAACNKRLSEGTAATKKTAMKDIPDNANALDPVAFTLTLPATDVKAKP